jgi:hypothetical protein
MWGSPQPAGAAFRENPERVNSGKASEKVGIGNLFPVRGNTRIVKATFGLSIVVFVFVFVFVISIYYISACLSVYSFSCLSGSQQ